MAATIIPTLPEIWCISSTDFSGKYSANKVYLGRENNLRRHTTITLKIVFKDLADQKLFFDWWINETDRGATPFYAKLPLYADLSYYLLAQFTDFTQTIEPDYSVLGTCVLYQNKTKDMEAPPIARDVTAYVEENSDNNLILFDAVDPDEGIITHYELVGSTPPGDTANVKGAGVYYSPATDYIGDRTLQYRATDGGHWSNTATIHIKVIQVGSPTAIDVVVEVVKGSAVDNERQVELNGFDKEGRPLTYQIVDQGSTGEGVIINDAASGKAIVSPLAASGIYTFTFTYKVNNGVHDSQRAVVLVKTKEPTPIEMNIPLYLYAPAACLSGLVSNYRIQFLTHSSDGLKLSYGITNIAPKYSHVKMDSNGVLTVESVDNSPTTITYTLTVNDTAGQSAIYHMSVHFVNNKAILETLYKSVDYYRVFYKKGVASVLIEPFDNAYIDPSWSNIPESFFPYGVMKISTISTPSNGTALSRGSTRVPLINYTPNDPNADNTDSFVVTIINCLGDTHDFTVYVETEL